MGDRNAGSGPAARSPRALGAGEAGEAAGPDADPLDALLDATPAGAPVVVVSPHLDDAALSCPSLLTAAPRPVVVVTLFSSAGPGPWPPMGRRIARADGHPDPDALFADRRAEDAEVLDRLGSDHRHLGFVEAPYRRGRRSALARHGRPLYPTFVLDALRGRVSRGDRTLATGLQDALREVLEATCAGVVLLPVGTGLHVDHLLARDAAAAAAGQTGRAAVRYEDYPYSSRSGPPPGAVHDGLRPVERQRTGDDVVRVAGGYRTQFDVLFPGGEVPVVPERYWLPAVSR